MITIVASQQFDSTLIEDPCIGICDVCGRGVNLTATQAALWIAEKARVECRFCTFRKLGAAPPLELDECWRRSELN